uniref:Uncharacterized protein n=1 Tax=Kalanchoe fedtschenkoi TaxID=63787 RepID=A0A7N0UE23_KALFE
MTIATSNRYALHPPHPPHSATFFSPLPSPCRRATYLELLPPQHPSAASYSSLIVLFASVFEAGLRLMTCVDRVQALLPSYRWMRWYNWRKDLQAVLCSRCWEWDDCWLYGRASSEIFEFYGDEWWRLKFACLAR